MADIILEISVTRTLEIVHELRHIGWVQHVDFDFACHKQMFDSQVSDDQTRERHTVFTFYNDSNASYFMLRWG